MRRMLSVLLIVVLSGCVPSLQPTPEPTPPTPSPTPQPLCVRTLEEGGLPEGETALFCLPADSFNPEIKEQIEKLATEGKLNIVLDGNFIFIFDGQHHRLIGVVNKNGQTLTGNAAWAQYFEISLGLGEVKIEGEINQLDEKQFNRLQQITGELKDATITQIQSYFNSSPIFNDDTGRSLTHLVINVAGELPELTIFWKEPPPDLNNPPKSAAIDFALDPIKEELIPRLRIVQENEILEWRFKNENEGWIRHFSLNEGSLTPEQAKFFLVGGEYLEESDLVQFEGRLFQDPRSGATLLLSKAVYEHLLSQIPPERLSTLSEEEVKKIVTEMLGESEWMEVFEEGMRAKPGEYWRGVPFKRWVNADPGVSDLPVWSESQPPPVLFLEENNQPVVVFLADDVAALNNYDVGYLGRIGEEGKVVFKRIPLFGATPKDIGSQWRAVAELDFRLLEKSGQLVADDGYQLRAILEMDDQGKPTWRQILPHERKTGEYELLTPDQRMRKAMADLEKITGYNGEGLWEKRPNTTVDYTDTQGNKHHQEVEVYFVHADQNPESPVVYEVIKDPATGEMMFTIRAAKENQEKIKGLNEQQAALVRQAWAYLLAADPEVMRKFWRVNKVGGVGIKADDDPATTNWLIGGQVGLILFDPRSPFGGIKGTAETIVGESYELYVAEFGYGEGYLFSSLPPDARDKNAMVDAALRYSDWITTYGLSIGLNPRRWLEDFYEKIYGRNPITPRIPFEP